MLVFVFKWAMIFVVRMNEWIAKRPEAIVPTSIEHHPGPLVEPELFVLCEYFFNRWAWASMRFEWSSVKESFIAIEFQTN